MDDNNATPIEEHGPFRVIRRGQTGENWGAYQHTLGISAATVGAKALSLDLQTIPPGAESPPHLHAGFEAALFILSGTIEHRYGPGLQQIVLNGPGDMLYVQPDIVHVSRNPSADEPVVLIVARTTADGASGNLLASPAGG